MDNNTKKQNLRTAVALGYNAGEEAPKILASGKGYVADKIMQIAKDEKVPIHKDDALSETLSKLEIGDFIPSELYGVVAEILVMVNRAEKQI